VRQPLLTNGDVEDKLLHLDLPHGGRQLLLRQLQALSTIGDNVQANGLCTNTCYCISRWCKPSAQLNNFNLPFFPNDGSTSRGSHLQGSSLWIWIQDVSFIIFRFQFAVNKLLTFRTKQTEDRSFNFK
jgi:hypothetical protein